MLKSNRYNKLPRIAKILAVEPYRVTCAWTTGEIRVVDLESLIRAKSHSVDSKYRALLDPDYFAQVLLDEELRTIRWDNGLDFCPDMLYELSAPSGVQPSAHYAATPSG